MRDSAHSGGLPRMVPAIQRALLLLALLLCPTACGGGTDVAEERRARGLALEGQGKFHDALWEYEEGIRTQVTSPALWYHAGYLYMVGGDTEGAQRRFQVRPGTLRADRARCAELHLSPSPTTHRLSPWA